MHAKCTVFAHVYMTYTHTASVLRNTVVDRDSARLQQIYDSQAVKRVHGVALQLHVSFRVSYKLKVKSIGLAEI